MIDLTTIEEFECYCNDAADRLNEIKNIKASESLAYELRESPDHLTNEAIKRQKFRIDLLQGEDAIALERVVNGNDLMPVSFLERADLAANSVGRVHVHLPSGRNAGFGTGFLIAPDLLLTNNHVLRDKVNAVKSFVEFDFEFELDGMPRPTTSFRFLPKKFFYTSKELDFTIVAVDELSANAKPLSSYSFLPLIEASGKALQEEKVTIIQHPSGGSKQVALRDNRVIGVLDDFIHYETDTLPGSSGSPVLNDQMQVVALHHSGVPSRNGAGQLLTKDGSVWSRSMGEDKIHWIANEGIRISRIFDNLRNSVRSGEKSDAHDILQRLERSSDLRRGSLGGLPKRIEDDIFEAELALDDYANLAGFDPKFLGGEVPFPLANPELAKDIAPLSNGKESVLNYTHYSVMVSKSRSLAIVSAVNIDGKQTKSVHRGADRWLFDPRMSREYQTGNALYIGNPLDRGHLVRRLDPVWGTDDVAETANRDTFHWVNCAPQHAQLNQKIWLGLENYILQNADRDDMKVSVFNGPVFRSDDMLYRDKYRIPAEYWKVVAFRREDGSLGSAAYLQTQKNLIANIDDLEFAFGQYKTFQVPLIQIEDITGLKFDGLEGTDVLANEQSGIEIKIEENMIL